MIANVSILGTKYKIVVDNSLKDTQADGICQTYDKLISVRPIPDMLGVNDCFKSKEARFREVIRHEIVHAFFEEAGLSDYCSDERLVDWIAKQFPKMLKAMRSAGGLNYD
jgi:hypothetical protein